MIIAVNTFELGTDKEAALKPLEEAAEVFSAWQGCSECELYERSRCVKCDCFDASALAYEIADCITACCNLAARHNLDIKRALAQVETHNRERGRYDSASTI